MNGSADLFVLLPFAALGVAGAALVALSHLPRRAALTGAVALVCLAVVVRRRRVGHDAGTTGWTLERADIDGGPGQPAARRRDRQHQRAPGAGHRRAQPPRRAYQYFSASVQRYLDGTYPGGMQGYIQGLQRDRPTIVAVGSTFRGLWPYGWLTRDYVRIGGGVGVSWYVARAAGQAAIDRARGWRTSSAMRCPRPADQPATRRPGI